MEMDEDKQKGLDWFVNLNSELKRENQKLQTELFFYKKSSEESKETISRILKKNDPNEMGYIFLNESARKFLKYLTEESCKMKEIIKNKDMSLNVSNFIEQKIKIEDLQNQINSRNNEISVLKNQIENNNEVSILYSKVSSLSIENYNLKIELLSKQNAMDYLQTSLKGFQRNLVKIFCDLYKVYGDTFLNKLKSDFIFSECLVPEFSFEENKNQVNLLNDELNQCKKFIEKLLNEKKEYEQNKIVPESPFNNNKNQINLLNDELNQCKKIIEKLLNEKKDYEQNMDAVLRQTGQQEVLNNKKIQELEHQLKLANKDKESFAKNSCYFEIQCAELNEKLKNQQEFSNIKIQDLERKLILANKEKESFAKTSHYFESKCGDLNNLCAELEKKLEIIQPSVRSTNLPTKFPQEPYAFPLVKPNNFQQSGLVCDSGTVVRDGAKSSEKHTKNQLLHLSSSDSKFDIIRSKDAVLTAEVVKSRRDGKSAPTSPQKKECLYCFKFFPMDVLETHQILCGSRFGQI